MDQVYLLRGRVMGLMVLDDVRDYFTVGRFDPTDRDKAPDVKTRRNVVLRRMADLGYISERTRAQGSALPLGNRSIRPPTLSRRP